MDEVGKNRTATRSSFRTFILGSVFWTALGLIFALPLLPGNEHWLGSLWGGFTQWWSWGILTPAIVALDQRLLLSVANAPRRITAHLLVGILFTGLYAYVFSSISALMRLAPWSDLLKMAIPTGAFKGLFWSLLVYFLIVGIAELYQFQKSYLSAALHMERPERSFSEARLNALRMQLDPHFLFNALNTISSQIIVDPKLARRMIEHLGDLLRAPYSPKESSKSPSTTSLRSLNTTSRFNGYALAKNCRSTCSLGLMCIAPLCRASCCSLWSRMRSGMVLENDREEASLKCLYITSVTV